MKIQVKQSIVRSVYDEVESYLHLPQIPTLTADSACHDKNILSWWKDVAPSLPFLSKMARGLLAAPASFAAPERLFSRAGKNHDGLKKCTSETTLENYFFVAINYPDA